MKQDHAEGDYGEFSMPDPAEKTAGDIDNEQEQQSVEPERGKYHFRCPHTTVDSNAGYT
jgi:hypothetical protein